MTRDDDTRTARQIARSKQKRAGDRSARLASALMKLAPNALDRLALDEDTRAAVDRARAITSHVARRRAERSLAGELRRIDLVELDERLANLEQGGAAADVRRFHLAEQWRTRLIEEGTAAAAELPGGATDELGRLIAAARRQRDTGKPPGAARALFRHVSELLEASDRAKLLGDD